MCLLNGALPPAQERFFEKYKYNRVELLLMSTNRYNTDNTEDIQIDIKALLKMRSSQRHHRTVPLLGFKEKIYALALAADL
jgi:hypothetical protein